MIHYYDVLRYVFAVKLKNVFIFNY